MPPTLSNVQCKYNSQLLVYKFKIQILTLGFVMANAATLITNNERFLIGWNVGMFIPEQIQSHRYEH
jgi:hypothetical protein